MDEKEDVPQIDKETKRLAVVNVDWGRIQVPSSILSVWQIEFARKVSNLELLVFAMVTIIVVH